MTPGITEGQTNEPAHEQTDGQTNRPMGVQTDRRTDVQYIKS